MTKGLKRTGPVPLHLPEMWSASGGPVLGAMLGTLLLSSAAIAQTATPPAPRIRIAQANSTAAEPNVAVTTLLEQVEYWQTQNRPELAKRAVDRLLAASPNDPEVLALAADISAQLGDSKAVDTYLTTLRRLAPNDPRIERIGRQRSFSEADRAALEEARGLAQSGRPAEAVARYRALFPNDDLPDNVIPEFYQTMAGINLAGFREATNALSQRVARDPDNLRLQLILAQIQTYRETTRYAGIDTLIRLMKNPAQANGARAAWRQALLWEGPSGELIEALQTYMATNPADAQITAKLSEAEASLPDAATQARMRGFAALQANKTSDAETELNASLALKSDDPTAVAGLGMVRLQQGRLDEALQLRDRAIALAPDRRPEFVEMLAHLGFAYLIAGRVAEAEQIFLGQPDKPQEDAGQLAGLGLVRLRQGKIIEARALRDRALAMAPERQKEFIGMFFGLGFVSLQKGDIAEAEKTFETALAKEPDDAGSLAGMAYVRFRQGRQGEARDYREKALAAAGDDRANITSMLAAINNPGAGRGGAGGPSQPSPSALARRALAQGDLNRADDYARRAARSNPGEQAAAELILGQIALRRDDLTTAETRFRAALARRPRTPEGLSGLYDVLQRQNRFAEAEALQQETGFVPGGNGYAATRAYAMRDEAARLEDPAQALDLLGQAKALDAKNPWVRLDIVRLLRGQGNEAEAAREEQDLLRLGNSDATYAAALVALEQERYDDVIARLETIPSRVRSADATRLMGQAQQQLEVTRLEQLARAAPGQASTQRLMALAARPDPTGSMASGVVRAFGRLKQNDAAARAAQMALAANRNATADFRIQLAGALLGASRSQDATPIIDDLLAETNVTEEQRRQIASLMAGSAIARAGELSAEGAQDAALAELLPAQQQLPNNVSVNMAVARVYLATSRATEAQVMADAALSRNPGNLEALTVAADAAMARRDWRRAEAVLQEARGRHPTDPQVMLMDARLARSQGDNYRALRSLESAGVRRYSQLQAGGARNGGDATLLAARLRGNGTAATESVEITDPVAAQIASDLKVARAETVTWLQAGLGLRSRSGQGGLSRLTETTVPVEASFAVPQVGGRITARAETVILKSGSLGSNSVGGRDFGTNPLATGTSGSSGNNGRATGEALNVAYAYGNVRADIGSTPLGFRTTNAEGGFEYAPALTDRLRLRMGVESRAVTDSLLSYGGMRDSRTGTTWGGVTRTSGRAQLEYVMGNTALYGGGSYATIDGRNVAGNTRYEVGGGVSWTVLRQPDQQVTLGIDTRYTSYDKNLGYYTLGQGGYFSPQSQFSAVALAEWRKRIGDVRLRLGGSLGWQTYDQDASLVFPNNPSLQAELVAAAAGNPNLNTSYAAGSGSGIIGGLRGEVEYDITPQWRLSAGASYDRSGDWHQATGLVRLRYSFDQPGPDLLSVAR
jgi:tetratricopeptide (TPR) repeat protein